MTEEGRPLEARLWGEARFSHRGVPVAPTSRKALALLAYLAAAGAPVPREELAALLWGPGRLANVRQALYTLRGLPGAGEWLDDGAAHLGVAATTDVARLAQAAPEDVPELEAELEGAEFLLGLDGGLPAAYQDWLARERARHGRLLRQALAAGAAAQEASGDLAAAVRLAARAKDLDPYDEEALRAYMRLAHLAGDSAGALAAHAAFASRLARDVGAEPAPPTSELALRIERREPMAPRLALPALTDADRRTVQALALADGKLRLDGLARVLERAAFELAADLGRIGERGVIDEGLGLGQQAAAIRRGVPAPLRRLLHERIVAVMRDDPAADQAALARHLLSAGERHEAVRRALAAAREAPEAATDLLYLAALAAYDAPEAKVEACLLLEGVAAQHAEHDWQEALLDEARRLAWELQSDAALAEGCVRRTRLLLARGRVGEALEEALQALEIALRMNEPHLVARARNAVGAAHFYLGDLEGAALAFAANTASDDEVERARAHNNLGSISAMRGRPEDSCRHFDEALTLARRHANHLDVSATLNNLAASAERLGNYARAERHFREGIGLARRQGAARREAEMLVNLAVVYARQGQLGPAWNTTAEVQGLADELADGRLAMRAAEQRGEVLRLCGELGRADEELAQALELATALGDERKRRALAAQLNCVRARLAPTLLAEAEAAIEALEAANLTDVAPWLRLELATWTDDVAFGREQLGRAPEAALKSSHQRLVRHMAEMRFGLLRGATVETLAAAQAARERLRALGLLPPAPKALTKAGTSEPIVERPKALYLALALDAPGAELPAVPQTVLAELREQGAGLPKAMAAALLRSHELWLGGRRGL